MRWYQLGSLTATPTVVQSGTLYSTHWFRQLRPAQLLGAVDRDLVGGRAVIGFSAAGTSEFINARRGERFSSDAADTLRAPQLYTRPRRRTTRRRTPGSAARGRRWGGVSSTVVDGCDGSTIWTMQQFTDAVELVRAGGGPDRRPGRPDARQRDAVGHRRAASASINLQVTATSSGGTAFFDSGAGYLCRIGAIIPGVTVNSVTRTGPTTVDDQRVDGERDPRAQDDQRHQSGRAGRDRAARILRVMPGPFVVIDSPVAGSVGQPLTVRGWAVDGTVPTGTGVDAVHVYATPAGGAASFSGRRPTGRRVPTSAACTVRASRTPGFTLTAAVSAAARRLHHHGLRP